MSGAAVAVAWSHAGPLRADAVTSVTFQEIASGPRLSPAAGHSDPLTGFR